MPHPRTMGRGSRWGRLGAAAQPTILEFVQAYLDPSGCGVLSGGDDLPGSDDDSGASRAGMLGWMPGARDGVAGHHFGAGPAGDVGEMIALMGRAISSRFNPVEFGRLYERLRAGVALADLDELLGAVGKSALPRSG